MSNCQTPGCRRHATGHGRYCDSHRSRRRRHGHPLQETITAARLKPYVALVRNWVARQRRKDLWQVMEAAWAAAVERAQATLAEYRSGRASLRHEVQACEDIVRVAEAAPKRRIVETVVAMAVMQVMEPRVFRSDDAFWCQLARRFRGLSDVHCGSYWNHKEGRVKRVYRDPKPKAGEALGQILMTHLGTAGPQIVRSEEAERKRVAEARMTMHRALTECVR